MNFKLQYIVPVEHQCKAFRDDPSVMEATALLLVKTRGSVGILQERRRDVAATNSAAAVAVLSELTGLLPLNKKCNFFSLEKMFLVLALAIFQ